ncbi:MAG: hypothetical protein N2376_06940, partial [Clostridia bacterium]|nr:hypothetical protein [Clostridia bacterium]
MRKIISAVLTVSMILGSSSMAFAQPKNKVSHKPSTTVNSQTDATTSATTTTAPTKKSEVKKVDTKSTTVQSAATG